MPFLRFTRDRRGYENTFLLHAAQPSDRPRVLYWYRTAPGVRVGRPALDEDAIRVIEEQHPEIEFDWPHILEVGASSAPEVEHRQVRPRRKPQKPREETAALVVESADTTVDEDSDREDESERDRDSAMSAGADDANEATDAIIESDQSAPPPPAHSLLDQLVGREIATRLRGRYAEISARIRQRAPDETTREIWQARAAELDPDSWVTPEEILNGVSRADELFDALRRELLS